MKHLLSTLFVSTPGTYLAREGDTVLIRRDHETAKRQPIIGLGGIVCIGQVSCSPPLMQLCAENDVPISFVSERGDFYARVQGPVSGNVLLRREQFRRADDPVGSGRLAKAFVSAKIANGRNVLLRAAREHSDTESARKLSRAAESMAEQLRRVQETTEVDVIRGIEGIAAQVYFSVFDHLITAQKDDFSFHERSRRPPLDYVNALLSYVYTVLTHDVSGALESHGLDPAVGFLHRDRPGRPSLALDIMEEFRPSLADRLVLSLINRRQVQGKGFQTTETGAVQMKKETRTTLLKAYHERKQEEIHHPYLGETVQIGLLPHIQAQLLARHLRGDLDGYPPFLWK